MIEKAEYELMRRIKEEVNCTYPDGIDTVTDAVGSAKEIIKWLLKNDPSIQHLTISKRKK